LNPREAMSPRSRAQDRASLFRRGLYFLLGLILFPACGAVGYSTVRQVSASGDFRNSIVYFFIGFASYLTFFLAFRKPLRPYLLGHELTHALWVVLFRGRVHEIRLSKERGQIRATKTNTLIALAPYFFPLYTVLLILGYSIASIWINFGVYQRVVVFAIGFTWSFHVLLNLHMLRQGQEDLRMSGRFFSLVIILLLNLIVFGLIMGFISDAIALKSYLSRLGEDVVTFYRALLQAAGI
jgi:hypothetical protein